MCCETCWSWGNYIYRYGAPTACKYLACCDINSFATRAVNKDQKNCCELADQANYKILADALELAVIYQPRDDMMALYDEEHRFPFENHAPIFIADSTSMTPEDLEGRIRSWVSDLARDLYISESRAETLLDFFSWDVQSVRHASLSDPSAVLAKANMCEAVKPAPALQTKPAVDVPAVKEDIQESTVLDNVIDVTTRDIDLFSVGRAESGDNTTDVIETVFSAITHEENVLSTSATTDQIVENVFSTIIHDENTASSLSDAIGVEVDEGLNRQGDEKLDCKKLVAGQGISSIEDPLTPTLEKLSAMALAQECASVRDDSKLGTDNTCSICCEPLRPPISPEELCGGEVEKANESTVRCPAGHTFCLGCWRTQLQMQVREDSIKTLQCPAYKCGERLCQREWAKAILVDDVLVDRLRSTRLSYVADCSQQLRRCPGDDCGLTVCVEVPSTTQCALCGWSGPTDASHVDSHICMGSGGNTSLAGGFSSSVGRGAPATCKTAICSNGHSFCLECNEIAHAPCPCDSYSLWSRKVAEELKHVEGDGSSNDVANALWLAANCKRCPRCQTPIEKDEGCNHMACRKCRYEFCWICMQVETLSTKS